jgi:hypothetical protein
MDENILFYYCIESYALFRTELLLQRSGAIGAVIAAIVCHYITCNKAISYILPKRKKNPK